MIEAKSVSNKFWILKEGNVKVGEVNNTQRGYTISINGEKSIFKTLEALKGKTGIKLSTIESKKSEHLHKSMIYDYPAVGEIHNALWNLQLKLPLYTKRGDSKSFFAAGYYVVQIKGKWKKILSPKLITIFF